MGLINREVILAKTEVTYGTDSVPVEADDAMLVENISWSNEGLRMNERPAVRASLGQLQQVFGGTLRTMTFDVELKGSGAAGTPPEFAPLLRACAMSEAVSALTSVTYEPESDPASIESITIYYFEDGKRYIYTGVRGSVSFNFETGALGKMSFTLTGHLTGPTDVALVDPVLLTIVPEAILNAAFSVGGFAAVINALSLDLANTVAMPPDMASTDGYAEVQITARDPNGSYDPEAELVATEDPWADLISDAALAFSVGPIGASAGNIIDFDMPAVSYRDLSPGDRDGVRTYEIPYGAAEASGDDEVSLVFT